MKQTDKKFSEWLDTFISEKGIDLEETFTFEDDNTGFNVMPYGVVIEAAHGASLEEQNIIKATLVKIDFIDGDVRHYLRHLGQSMVASKYTCQKGD